MTTYAISGRSPISRGGGGEGPWYSDGGCGFIDVDGVTGEYVVVWGLNGSGGGPSVTGPATIATVVAGSTMGAFIVTFTDVGTAHIAHDPCNFGGLLAHKPTSPLTVTACG